MSKITLKEVAEMAGVSRSTASRVLRKQGSVSKKARENVLRIVDQTGFQPNAAARSLAGVRTNVIGLFITEISRHIFNDPYFGRLIEGVAQTSNQMEQTLTLFLLYDDNDATRMTERILQNPLVDGLIISSTNVDNPLVDRLLERELPFVVVGRHENPRVSYVDTDNVNGAFAAVNHLFRQGYRRIGTITGTLSNYSAIDRLEGYRKAHAAWGHDVDESLIYEGAFVEMRGYEGMKSLIEKKVDAVFAASDMIANGALIALSEAGLRVPEDIAIVGFDDLPLAINTNPPLTTIRQTIRQTGKHAVETLLDLVGDESMPPRRTYLPTELVIRSSCGALSN